MLQGKVLYIRFPECRRIYLRRHEDAGEMKLIGRSTTRYTEPAHIEGEVYPSAREA